MNKSAIRYAALEAGLDAPIHKEILAKLDIFLSAYCSLTNLLYTPEQFARWEQDIRDEERKKVNVENRKALYKYCQAWK